MLVYYIMPHRISKLKLIIRVNAVDLKCIKSCDDHKYATAQQKHTRSDVHAQRWEVWLKKYINVDELMRMNNISALGQSEMKGAWNRQELSI